MSVTGDKGKDKKQRNTCTLRAFFVPVCVCQAKISQALNQRLRTMKLATEYGDTVSMGMKAVKSW